MNSTSASVPPDVDEFELSGLTPVDSRKVKPPRVGESRVAMECKLSQLVQLRSAAGKAIESWLVLGEVVMVHIDRTLLKDGIYDTAAAHPILRAGGPSGYAEIRPENMFEMIRPA
jgi:flavin reductase (DIM6/NTAB) family NADH-FMN oxidoreductase RutF